MRARFAVPFVGMAIALVGCPSPTQRSLKRAAKALEECDVRTANAEFADAFDKSPDDIDAALGFALTEILLLPEDPDLNRGFERMGLSRPIDSEALVWGKDAFIDRLARGECDMDDLGEAELQYPPFWQDSDPSDYLKGDPSVGDLLADAAAMDKRFRDLARAFESAAVNLDGAYALDLEGSCTGDLGPVAIQVPELFAAASAFTALRASIATAQGYDWDLALRPMMEEDVQTLVDAYNAHLLRVVDPGGIDDSASLWLDALDLADAALDAAVSIDEPVDDQIFDWSKLDRSFVADLRIIGDAGRASIAEGGMRDVPFWTPSLQADVGSLFTDPVDASGLDQPLFRLDGRSLEAHQRSWEALFVDRFDRDIFNSQRDEYWDLDHWEDVDLESVLDPDGRWTDAFECD